MSARAVTALAFLGLATTVRAPAHAGDRRRRTAPGRRRTAPGRRRTAPGRRRTAPDPRRAAGAQRRAAPGRPRPTPTRGRRAAAPRPPGAPPRPLTWLGLARDPVVVDAHPRIRQRIAEHLRARRRRDQVLTASAGVLIALALLALGVARSPLLSVDEVRLVGMSGPQRSAVAERLGVDPGENVLDVDLQAVARRAEALPWVEEATPRRRLPSTLELRVAVSRPVATAVVGGTRYLLDAEATVVEAGPVDAPEGTFVTVDGSPEDLPDVVLPVAPEVGTTVAVPDVVAAAEVAALMPRVVADWVVAYHPGGEGEVDAVLRVPSADGPVELVVHLGRPEDVTAKAAALVALVEETVGRGLHAAALDVRIPDRPVVRTS